MPQSTRQNCLDLAEAAGFDAYRAGQVCDVAFGESGYGADTRCACAYTDGGTIYHDAECDSRGLTKHCGVFQMGTDNPTFAPVVASGCANDLACSLKAMFGITQGGQCFDGPNPWGPHFGQHYGACGGQADPSLQSTSPDCKQCSVTNIGACLKCSLQNVPGPFGPSGGGSGITNPVGAVGDIGKLIGDILDPRTWLNVGLVIAGFVTAMLGINAVLSGGGGKAQSVNLPQPTLGKLKALSYKDVAVA